MIRDEAIKRLKRFDLIGSNEDIEFQEALDMAIKALERKPHEKFESTKDHIYKLAGDYKCWDNRLTQDEALELCHILEKQEPCTLDDAREDFVFDVYNILDFLPTNDEANRIIGVFDRVTSDIGQEPILDKIRAEIENHCGLVKNYHCETCYRCWTVMGVREILEIIDKYRAESEGEEE